MAVCNSLLKKQINCYFFLFLLVLFCWLTVSFSFASKSESSYQRDAVARKTSMFKFLCMSQNKKCHYIILLVTNDRFILDSFCKICQRRNIPNLKIF